MQNNLNPEFKKKIELDYTFEKKQELKFIVYDWWTPLALAGKRPEPAGCLRSCAGHASAQCTYTS